MVVFQHHHRRQVIPMGCYSSNQQWVLLYHSEARRRLPGSCNLSMPSTLSAQVRKSSCVRGNTTGPAQTVESDTFPEKNVSHPSNDRRRKTDRLKEISFYGNPLHATVETVEYGVEEGDPGQHTGALADQHRRFYLVSYDESSIVEVWRVLPQPLPSKVLQSDGME